MTPQEIYALLCKDPASLFADEDEGGPGEFDVATLPMINFKGIEGEAFLTELVMAGSERFGFKFSSGIYAGKEIFLSLDWTGNHPALIKVRSLDSKDLLSILRSLAESEAVLRQAREESDGIIRFVYQVDDSSDGMWFNTARRDVDYCGGDPIDELDGSILEIGEEA